ncbi:MAG: hypothetical protein ACHP84_17405 [Caulobacterales bacterium]
MDRSRRRSGLLTGALVKTVLAAGLIAAAAPSAPPLRAMRWLAPGVDAADVLTRRPTECLGAPATAEAGYEVELGRAAFRTPLLLGGQAARAGLSCESCHRDGRNNPDFHFPGVSGAPGTADVTTAVLSSHRGDDVFDPKPIPDLSGPKDRLKVDQDPASRKLEAFIDGIVTQEFDGAEPPPSVLGGLAAYVRALSPQSCPAAASEPVTAGSMIDDASRAVRAAQAALQHHDAASADLMAAAALSRLEDVAERYPGDTLAPARADLAVAALDLKAARAAIRAGDPGAADRLSLWIVRSRTWAPRVEALADISLFDRGRLAQAARPRRGDPP